MQDRRMQTPVSSRPTGQIELGEVQFATTSRAKVTTTRNAGHGLTSHKVTDIHAPVVHIETQSALIAGSWIKSETASTYTSI